MAVMKVRAEVGARVKVESEKRLAALREPAVTELVTVRDREMLREPLKELEPAPWPVRLPKRVRLPDEARVTKAVLELLTNCNDSEETPLTVPDLIKNLC